MLSVGVGSEDEAAECLARMGDRVSIRLATLVSTYHDKRMVYNRQ